jgi:restriction system protein
MATNGEIAVTAPIATYDRLMWPVVLTLRSLGNSAALSAIEEELVRREQFSELQQAILHGSGPKSEIFYRMQWALTYLKAGGVSDSNGRGTHWLTELGQSVSEDEVSKIPGRVRATRPRKKESSVTSSVAPESNDTRSAVIPIVPPSDDDWKQELSAILTALNPAAFERLCQRLLIESGFTKVEVTGRSGDGGIDGTGVLRIGGLLSFQVLFQCKRYRGSVGSEEIRNFRGAMVGRSDKGLFLTTGTFTAEARREGTRDGAPPLDLIDGEQLCDLLKDRRMGLRTEVVEKTIVVASYFTDI